MNILDFENILWPQGLKKFCGEIAEIIPADKKIARGILLLYQDGAIGREVLENSRELKECLQVDEEKVVKNLYFASEEINKLKIHQEEEEYYHKEIREEELHQIKRRLKKDCGENGEYSLIKMRLKGLWGMKNYLEKMCLLDIEEKILELIGHNEAKERDMIETIRRRLVEIGRVDNDEEEDKFFLGIGLSYNKQSNLEINLIIENASSEHISGINIRSFPITNTTITILNIICDYGEYEDDIKEAFDLNDD